MEIPYKKRRLKFNLFFGIIWMVFFMSQFLLDEELKWIDYSLVLSLVYFGTYYYQKKYKYLNISSGILNINGPLGKRINLHEVKQIRSFAGDYILKTEKKEVTINTQIIDLHFLAELNAELEKLDTEWT